MPSDLVLCYFEANLISYIVHVYPPPPPQEMEQMGFAVSPTNGKVFPGETFVLDINFTPPHAKPRGARKIVGRAWSATYVVRVISDSGDMEEVGGGGVMVTSYIT